jgi:anti-sigma regulatory factor (Ser/Thr protein kinase)
MEVSSLDGAPISCTVDERSAVGEVRRSAIALAGELGFSEEDAGRVALIVTEAATNLVQHGGGGEVLIRAVTGRAGSGVEVLVLDRGVGIGDLLAAARDGYSTAGTPGTGLGAVARTADLFDIYTAPGLGTVLFARAWKRPAPATRRAPAGLELGAVCLPRRGERVTGDAWAAASADGGIILLVADGLGHGPAAAAASAEAIRIFRQRRYASPGELIADTHAALKSTRGAALAAALLDRERHEIRYAGVGNIAGTIVAGSDTRSMVSHNGTVGHELRKIQEFVYPWPPGALIVMQSDGLQAHWRLDRYPTVAARHPGVIAGLLYRDFNRRRDDVTVVSVRESAAGPVPGDLPFDA